MSLQQAFCTLALLRGGGVEWCVCVCVVCVKKGGVTKNTEPVMLLVTESIPRLLQRCFVSTLSQSNSCGFNAGDGILAWGARLSI